MSDGSSTREEWQRKGQGEWKPSPPTVDSERLDSLFDVLAVRRRRYLLYCLTKATDGVVERSQLVEAVQAFEEEDRWTEDASTEESIMIDLHHRQLPWLAGAGFVDYDHRQGTVRYAPSPVLDEQLERAHHHDLGRPL